MLRLDIVDVSAKKKTNLNLLLEMICLVSDIKAPKATPGRKAVGSVLEAKLDRGRGAVATVLVQDGTLKLNDSYIVGNTFGKDVVHGAQGLFRNPLYDLALKNAPLAPSTPTAFPGPCPSVGRWRSGTPRTRTRRPAPGG